MAFPGAKLFKGFGGKQPPDLLRRTIRRNIQLCWQLQEPEKRGKEDVRRIMLGILEDEIKDFDTLVKDL